MFCENCGKEVAENARFCESCGAERSKTSENFQSSAPITEEKPKKGGKKVGAIVMLVLGGLSILGSFANDYYWNIAHNGMQSSDFVTVGLQIGLVIGGFILLNKSKNN